MTQMDPDNDDRILAWLAGHADGELDVVTRQRVEDWLARDPEAAELLRDQESLSAANTEFWAAVEPPTISDLQWLKVENRIAERCSIPVTVRNPRWVGPTLFAAVAASVATVALFVWRSSGDDRPREIARPVERPPPEVVPEPGSPSDPLAGYAMISVAKPGEVLIESVRGGVSPWVIGPEHPVPDELTLAGPQDIQVETIRPATASGRMPEMKTEPGSVPMIYAAVPR